MMFRRVNCICRALRATPKGTRCSMATRTSCQPFSGDKGRCRTRKGSLLKGPGTMFVQSAVDVDADFRADVSPCLTRAWHTDQTIDRSRGQSAANTRLRLQVQMALALAMSQYFVFLYSGTRYYCTRHISVARPDALELRSLSHLSSSTSSTVLPLLQEKYKVKRPG